MGGGLFIDLKRLLKTVKQPRPESRVWETLLQPSYGDYEVKSRERERQRQSERESMIKAASEGRKPKSKQCYNNDRVCDLILGCLAGC